MYIRPRSYIAWELAWSGTPKSGLGLRGTVGTPRLRLSVLFTHPTPVSPCLAQRGSDMRGSTVYIPRSGSSTRYRLTLGKKALETVLMECKDKPKVN